MKVKLPKTKYKGIINKKYFEDTVEPQLSEPHGRHTIRSDNRGVRIDDRS